MLIIDFYSAESWRISTALCVLSGNDEIDSFSAIVWSCCWWVPGHGDCPVASSKPSDLRHRRPDDQKCWADNVVWSGDVEWLTVNDVGWECLRLVYSSPPSTLGPCSADSDAMWLPVRSVYVLGRRASAIPHAASEQAMVKLARVSDEMHCSIQYTLQLVSNASWWGKWKSDVGSVSRIVSPVKIDQFFPMVGPVIIPNVSLSITQWADFVVNMQHYQTSVTIKCRPGSRRRQREIHHSRASATDVVFLPSSVCMYTTININNSNINIY